MRSPFIIADVKFMTLTPILKTEDLLGHQDILTPRKESHYFLHYKESFLIQN